MIDKSQTISSCNHVSPGLKKNRTDDLNFTISLILPILSYAYAQQVGQILTETYWLEFCIFTFSFIKKVNSVF